MKAKTDWEGWELERESAVWRDVGDMRTKVKKKEKRPSYAIPLTALQNGCFIDFLNGRLRPRMIGLPLFEICDA